MTDDRYPSWPEMFRWLSALKDRVESIPAIGAEQVTTGTFSLEAMPGLSGTVEYYVAETPGGATTRKLTFTNGVLVRDT